MTGPGSAIALRRATIDDIDVLAAIHAASAQAAYAHVFPAGTPFPHADARADLLGQLARGGARAILATIDDVPGVFALAGRPADRTLDRTDIGELHLLHVLPDLWARGIGSRLLASAMAALMADGYRRAILWVLIENTRARRLYERHGWAEDGARAVEQHAATINIMRYARRL
jgi:ribosomal protein S18 acetylase RimI-like enzyme